MMKSVGTLCVALAASMAVLFAPAPAQAGNNDGFPDSGEFLQWYLSSYVGSCYDEYYDASSYAGQVFKSTSYCSGSGAGQNPANNQRSVANFDPNWRVYMWTGANYTGSLHIALRYGECPAANDCWYYSTLGGWQDNIESHYFA